jgi:ABC-type sugar transport system permease subunit
MLQHYMNNLFFRGDYPMLAMAAIILILLIIAFLTIMFALNRRAQKKLMG